MLLVDLGNTRGKLVAVVDSQLQPPLFWHYEEPLEPLLMQLLPSSICIASVAPKPYFKIFIDCAEQFGMPLQQVNAEPERFGVKNGYRDYAKLGVDRWLAMIGARQVCNQACIVVDAGTAITIDVLDDAGRHLGGWILPGLQMMQASLSQRSESLVIEASNGFVSGLGDSTHDAICAGTLHAVWGAVEQARMQVRQSHVAVLVTGGDATRLLPLAEKAATHHPDLLFHGLKKYADEFAATLS